MLFVLTVAWMETVLEEWSSTADPGAMPFLPIKAHASRCWTFLINALPMLSSATFASSVRRLLTVAVSHTVTATIRPYAIFLTKLASWLDISAEEYTSKTDIPSVSQLFSVNTAILTPLLLIV